VTLAKTPAEWWDTWISARERFELTRSYRDYSLAIRAQFRYRELVKPAPRPVEVKYLGKQPCPVCRKAFETTTKGTVWAHYSRYFDDDGWHDGRCPGSGMKIEINERGHEDA
jgi:hypothetical protein